MPTHSHKAPDAEGGRKGLPQGLGDGEDEDIIRNNAHWGLPG